MTPFSPYKFSIFTRNIYKYLVDDPRAKAIFNKTVIVHASSYCPTGFQLSLSTNGTACYYSQPLLNHHFQCTITTRGLTAEITYKSSTNKVNYWMGYLDQQLVFTDHCPSHYKGAPSIYARYAVAYHFWQLSWENNVNSNC